VKHKGALTIYYEIIRKKNIRLKLQTHKMSLDEGIRNMSLDRKIVVKSPSLMQQQNFDVLMYEKEQKFNRLERQEIVLRYNLLHLLIIKRIMRMQSLNKKLKF